MRFLNKQWIKISFGILVPAFVFAVSAILWLWISHKTEKEEKLYNNYLKLKVSFFEIKNKTDNFINTTFSSDFFENKEDKKTIMISDKTEICKKQIDVFKNFSLDFNEKATVNEIKQLLSDFEFKIELLKESILQKGNTKYGLISELYLQERLLSEKSDLFNLKSFKKEFSEIISYKNLAIEENNPLFVRRFTADLKKIYETRTEILEKDSAYDKRIIVDNLAHYKAVFNQVSELNNRIYGFDGTGLINDIHKIFDDADINISELMQNHIKASEEDRSFVMLLIFLWIISVATVSLSILYIRKKLKSGYEKIDKVVNGLTKEKLKVIKTESEKEIEDIVKKLNDYIGVQKKYDEIMKELSKLNFDPTYQLPENMKLSKSISTLINLLKEREVEIEKREKEHNRTEKHNLGLAEFGHLLRLHSKNIEDLTFNLITKLVDFLNVEIGGIYLLKKENETEFLELVAAYAYNEKRLIDKRIAIGEGIVGACASDKSLLYYDNLPDDYLQIVTGFNKIEPKFLVVAPIILNERIFGVLEIASINEIDKTQLDFIKALGENIAATLLYMTG